MYNQNVSIAADIRSEKQIQQRIFRGFKITRLRLAFVLTER